MMADRDIDVVVFQVSVDVSMEAACVCLKSGSVYFLCSSLPAKCSAVYTTIYKDRWDLKYLSITETFTVVEPLGILRGCSMVSRCPGDVKSRYSSRIDFKQSIYEIREPCEQ